LSGYRVVLTGSHSEYWTRQMLDAMETYLSQGGRLMHLGGNGMYWVTSVDPERPHVMEVRRGASGTRTYTSPPSEMNHSTTGEPGGLWQHRGRAPQKLVGVGFSAWGPGKGSPYRRLPASFDPRVKFVFEGIGDDEAIGEFGLVVGAAGGYEVDRMDVTLGTPPHALRLATADAYATRYFPAIEELMDVAAYPGLTKHLLSADMVYFTLPGGGGVFTTGSISWCGSLSWNAYDNNVSRITMNVLQRFLQGEPLPATG
jgi:N,N-dimethylformamidase